MALTMKNYKGFNKVPYCSAHYPQIKHTVVETTPEDRRCAQITKLNSGVLYRKDFEENIKGTATAVAEDIDSQRHRQIGSLGIGYGSGRPGNDDDDSEDQDRPSAVAPPGMRIPGMGGPTSPPPPPAASSGPQYRALYDYEAQDEDEVGFSEDDIILNCQVVDDGWMMGTVQKTGKRGMIPSNYIEQA